MIGGLDVHHLREFRRNWGIKAIRAGAAYAVGATGRGVKIAIIDTGIKAAPPDVLRNVSPHSIDLIGNRQDDGERNHGAHIASALAAAQDGAGLIGVAPEVTVLSVRADLDQPCRKGECQLAGPHVAQGIDYAVERGAQVIILSLAGGDPLSSVEPALARAADAGVALVVAAGNEGRPQAAWPARYAADPRYADAMVAVGAATRAGGLAKYSNRAGEARRRYLIAPGDKISVECDDRRCERASGTSFATAYVAGAVALLLDAFPELDGQTALGILLASAKDVGPRGVDTVNGHGHIDVARAFSRARSMMNRQLVADLPSS